MHQQQSAKQMAASALPAWVLVVMLLLGMNEIWMVSGEGARGARAATLTRCARAWRQVLTNPVLLIVAVAVGGYMFVNHMLPPRECAPWRARVPRRAHHAAPRAAVVSTLRSAYGLANLFVTMATANSGNSVTGAASATGAPAPEASQQRSSEPSTTLRRRKPAK